MGDVEQSPRVPGDFACWNALPRCGWEPWLGSNFSRNRRQMAVKHWVYEIWILYSMYRCNMGFVIGDVKVIIGVISLLPANWTRWFRTQPLTSIGRGSMSFLEIAWENNGWSLNFSKFIERVWLFAIVSQSFLLCPNYKHWLLGIVSFCISWHHCVFYCIPHHLLLVVHVRILKFHWVESLLILIKPHSPPFSPIKIYNHILYV